MASISSSISTNNGGMPSLHGEKSGPTCLLGREASISGSQESDFVDCISEGQFSDVNPYTAYIRDSHAVLQVDPSRQETVPPAFLENRTSQDSWWDVGGDPDKSFSPSEMSVTLPFEDLDFPLFDLTWLDDTANNCGDIERHDPTCYPSVQAAGASVSPVLASLSSTTDRTYETGLRAVDGSFDEYGLSCTPPHRTASRSAASKISSPGQRRHVASYARPEGQVHPIVGEEKIDTQGSELANEPSVGQTAGIRQRAFSPKPLHPKPAKSNSDQQGSRMLSGTWSARHKIQRVRNSSKTNQIHTPTTKDRFLVESKLAGMSYKEIKDKGGFGVAESTLRGRFRTLTKDKDRRVRKPEWEHRDVSHWLRMLVK